MYPVGKNTAAEKRYRLSGKLQVVPNTPSLQVVDAKGIIWSDIAGDGKTNTPILLANCRDSRLLNRHKAVIMLKVRGIIVPVHT